MSRAIAETVLHVSKSDKPFAVHMAIWFSEVDDPAADRHLENVIFEARQPRVTFDTRGEMYDSEPNKYVFDFEVDDETYQRAVQMAFRLEGRKYGLITDCLVAGFEDQTGDDISKFINCDNTVMCSEAGSRISHAMFPDFGRKEDGSVINFNTVTPIDAFHLLDDFFANKVGERVNMLARG